MTDEAAVADDGSEETATLPRRSDALRCPHIEYGERRCVLPPDHELDHVYPYQKAPALCAGE
ncbi:MULTISPECIES: hypothetical protein [unclassified Streptosporangium]|uniref:hypothetical protein n=1 Tax=unclassified Streptosporangium TaxID=2632669 RepID=UPI002E295632|nr:MULTISPECIES: hypothetical protein [unclassified Streptosporangium]